MQFNIDDDFRVVVDARQYILFNMRPAQPNPFLTPEERAAQADEGPSEYKTVGKFCGYYPKIPDLLRGYSEHATRVHAGTVQTIKEILTKLDLINQTIREVAPLIPRHTHDEEPVEVLTAGQSAEAPVRKFNTRPKVKVFKPGNGSSFKSR